MRVQNGVDAGNKEQVIFNNKWLRQAIKTEKRTNLQSTINPDASFKSYAKRW